MKNSTNLKQPSGLWLIGLCLFLFSFAQGWVPNMLVLYLQTHYGFTPAHSFAIFGSFYTLFFMMPLIGGVLVDKFGKYEAIICGSLFVVVGMFLVCIDHYSILLIGLDLLLVGAGIVVPAYYCSLGDLYGKNDVRRDSGFTFMYMIMNVGFFISLLLGAFLAKYIDYPITTFIFTFVVLFSIVFYTILHKKITLQNKENIIQGKVSLKSIILVIACGIILSIICIFPLLFSRLDYYFVGLILLSCAVGGIYIFRREKSRESKSKIILFYVLSFFALCFWTFYFLEPTLLTIFSKDNLDLNLFGINFPAESVFDLDPFFVVVSGFFLAHFWVKLEMKKKNPSLPTKFTIAPLWVTIGFCVLILEIYFNRSGLMSFYWMILAYFFFTLGELFLAPIGFSMAGKLAPKGHEGFFMGVWQVSIGGAATISSIMAGWFVMPDTGSLMERNTGYMHAFMTFAGIGLLLFIAAFILLPWMKRLVK